MTIDRLMFTVVPGGVHDRPDERVRYEFRDVYDITLEPHYSETYYNGFGVGDMLSIPERTHTTCTINARHATMTRVTPLGVANDGNPLTNEELLAASRPTPGMVDALREQLALDPSLMPRRRLRRQAPPAPIILHMEDVPPMSDGEDGALDASLGHCLGRLGLKECVDRLVAMHRADADDRVPF
jgi:hypothetical protein